MQVEARPFRQPVADHLRLVSALVVQDQMHIQFRRNVLFDGIEEVTELSRAMPLLGLAYDLACLGIERGEKAGCALASVIVGSPLDLAGAHGQQRRGTIQRLYLALLVHTQHQRTVRRREIEADDVAYLVDEQRIAAELEGRRALFLRG